MLTIQGTTPEGRGRGISTLPLIDGVEIGTLVELAQWTLAADKVLTF